MQGIIILTLTVIKKGPVKYSTSPMNYHLAPANHTAETQMIFFLF